MKERDVYVGLKKRESNKRRVRAGSTHREKTRKEGRKVGGERGEEKESEK